MTSIVAAPNKSLASVILTITATSPIRRVIRTDANGPHMVRFHPGQLPASGVLMVQDREPALQGPVRYDVDDGAAGATATTELGVTSPWLTVPVLRQEGTPVQTVHGYDGSRDTLSTFHYPIGRKDPLVTLGKMRTRTGTLKIYCPDHQAVAAMYRVASRGEVLFLRQAEHPGMDMYFIPDRDSAEPVDGGWEYSLDYVELAWPSDDLVGTPGWTFRDLKDSAETFETITERYLNFDHLLRDERI